LHAVRRCRHRRSKLHVDGWITRPLSLADALNLALKHNAAILKSERDVEASQGIVLQTRAVAIPAVRATGDFTKVDPATLERFTGAPTFFQQDETWNAGVKVVQSMMAGVDWITPWLPKEVVLCDGRGLHDISASEWVLTAILTSLKRFPYYRDMQLQREWKGQASVPNGFMDVGGAQVGQYAVLGDDLRKDGADCRVWLDRCVDRSSTEAIRGEEDSAGGTQRAEGT